MKVIDLVVVSVQKREAVGKTCWDVLYKHFMPTLPSPILAI